MLIWYENDEMLVCKDENRIATLVDRFKSEYTAYVLVDGKIKDSQFVVEL